MKCDHCGEKEKCSTIYCFSCHSQCKEDCLGDCFDIMGMKPCFKVDKQELEKKYRELCKVFHPDLCKNCSGCERKDTLEKSAAVNQAYKALKDDVQRARTLLEKACQEYKIVLPRNAVSQGFLVKILEIQEEVAEMAFEGEVDEDRLEEIEQLVIKSRERVFCKISRMFYWLERKPGKENKEAGKERLILELNRNLNTLPYFERILEQIERILDEH